MTRRFFVTFVIAALYCCGFALAAESQPQTSQWKEGVHYERIAPTAKLTRPVSTAIVVTEWFWLGCPHCDALEPHVLAWEKSLPKDVAFKRVAVAWDRPERIAHAKLYYTLEQLKRTDLRQAVFDTIHRGNNLLYDPRSEANTQELLRAFARSYQLDLEVFVKTYKSPDAERYVTQANEAAIAMHVPGVPAMSVDDKFTTDIARADGAEPLLQLVNYLIEKERQTR